MASTGKGREERAAKERARAYAARQALYRRGIERRRRDNLVAVIAGGILVMAIAGAQFAFYTVGPGVPVPIDTPTPTPTAPLEPLPPVTPQQ